VLDDYSVLRFLNKSEPGRQATLYPVKDALMYIPATPLGVRGKGFQGESFFTADNPPVGAVFTYYLKDDIKSLKEKRKDREKELIAKGESPYYPSADSLRLEDEQEDPFLIFVIRDEAGKEVRKLKAPPKKGLHRITWDFRYSSPGPIDFTPYDESFVFSSKEMGYLALPGNYSVQLMKSEDAKITPLSDPMPFKAVTLHTGSLPPADKKTTDEFSRRLAELRRVTAGADEYRSLHMQKIKYMKAALLETPGLPVDLSAEIKSLEKRLNLVNRSLNGDATLGRREFETLPAINDRIQSITGNLWNATSGPTPTMKQSLETAERQFEPVFTELRKIGADIQELEKKLEKAGAPYTPGRLPEWKKN
jgi:hypothetical protein